MAMKPNPICTIESCPWNGQPMSAHPKRDRSTIDQYLAVQANDVRPTFEDQE